METIILIGQIVIAILGCVLYSKRKRHEWIRIDYNLNNTCKRNDEYRIKLVEKDGEE